MLILYTVKNGGYVNLADSLKTEPQNVYVNLTNKCTCACTFCLRNTKQMMESNTLWLDREPSVEEVIAEFEKYDMEHFNEIVFCGFGEPTMRLEALLEIANYLKRRDKKVSIRINTNGLCELDHQKEIAPLLKGLVDTISISLNASNAEEYLRVTCSKFGIESYEAMLKFAVRCKDYIPHVVLTVVDCIGQKEIEACQAICDKIGVTLRVRSFE